MYRLCLIASTLLVKATMTTGDMNVCPRNFFRDDCSAYCNREATCNKRGICGRDGECICDGGYEGNRCEREINNDKKEWKCIAWGDPHMESFHNEKFDYHAEGWHVLHHQPNARVTTFQEECARGHMACIQEVHVVSGGVSVSVTVDGDVKVSTFEGESSSPRLSGGKSEMFGEVEVKKEGDKRFEFVVKGEDSTLKVTVKPNRGKRRLLDVIVNYEGELDDVTGICNDACTTDRKSAFGQTDCSRILAAKYHCGDEEYCNFGTILPGPDPVVDVPSPSPSPSEYFGEGGEGAPLPPAPTPEPEPEPPVEWPQMLWAFDCCMPFRKCSNDDDLFGECVEENARFHWEDSKEKSECSDSYQSILLERGLCEEQVCPPNFVGASCNRCKKDFYGPNCDQKCTREETCNGQGTCDSQGKCWCDSGASGEGCSESKPLVMIHFTHNKKMCVDLAGGGWKRGVQLHQWSCSKSNKNQQWEMVYVEGRTDRAFQLRNIRKQTCMTVDSRDKVRQATCKDEESQYFVSTPSGDIKSVHNKECFGIEGRSGRFTSKNGIRIEMKSCASNEESVEVEYLRGSPRRQPF